jgi:hypothetical protein
MGLRTAPQPGGAIATHVLAFKGHHGHPLHLTIRLCPCDSQVDCEPAQPNKPLPRQTVRHDVRRGIKHWYSLPTNVKSVVVNKTARCKQTEVGLKNARGNIVV